MNWAAFWWTLLITWTLVILYIFVICYQDTLHERRGTGRFAVPARQPGADEIDPENVFGLTYREISLCREQAELELGLREPEPRTPAPTKALPRKTQHQLELDYLLGKHRDGAIIGDAGPEQVVPHILMPPKIVEREQVEVRSLDGTYQRMYYIPDIEVGVYDQYEEPRWCECTSHLSGATEMGQGHPHQVEDH